MRYLAVGSYLFVVALSGCDGPAPTGVTAESVSSLLSRSTASCENAAGTVTAAFVEGQPWDIEGTLFDGDGTAIGEAYAWIDELEPRANGAMAISMRHRYLIDGSALDTVDQGVLTPKDPPVYWFNNRLEVVGGTEAFSGASGMIRSHGTVDLAGGDIQLAYHGRICW